MTWKGAWHTLQNAVSGPSALRHCLFRTLPHRSFHVNSRVRRRVSRVLIRKCWGQSARKQKDGHQRLTVHSVPPSGGLVPAWSVSSDTRTPMLWLNGSLKKRGPAPPCIWEWGSPGSARMLQNKRCDPLVVYFCSTCALCYRRTRKERGVEEARRKPASALQLTSDAS